MVVLLIEPFKNVLDAVAKNMGVLKRQGYKLARKKQNHRKYCNLFSLNKQWQRAIC